MNAITLLKNLKQAVLRDQHPNIPEYAIPCPRYTDKNANGLTRCIIDFLILSDHQAERINNTGRYLNKRKTVTDCIGKQRSIGSDKWIPGTGTNGTADISATIYGRSVKIEVKAGKDRQSEAQRQYQEQIEQAGGIYFVARSFQQFYIWYKETFEKQSKNIKL